jgi:hypothetical protein
MQWEERKTLLQFVQKLLDMHSAAAAIIIQNAPNNKSEMWTGGEAHPD